MLQAATGVAQSRPMDAGAAVELPTTAAKLGMILTVIEIADGARLHTDRADRRIVNVAVGLVLAAKMVVTLRLLGQVICAKGGVAEVTARHTLLAAFLATFTAVDCIGSKLAAAGTFTQTIEAKCSAASIELVEAGANLPPTLTAGDQAVGAETLARSSTDAKLRAVLLATWATNGTISTNERMNTFAIRYGVGAQVAAALACATFSTFTLAGKADIITADGAAFNMLRTGTFATGPTGCAAAFTVGFAAVGAGDDAALGADDFAACATLANTVIAADMPFAVECNDFAFTVAGMAGGALEMARIPVACDLDRGLAFAVAKVDLG